MGIRKKMAQGMLWVLLEKGGQQLLTFAIFTIVARLVGPEEYGLVGLCAAFSAFSFMVIFGVVDAVVSQRIRDDERMSTLFWTVTLIGAALMSGIYFMSVPFARFMSDNRLIDMIRWLSLIPFLSALSAMPDMIIHLKMEYKIFTICSVGSTIIAGIIAIIMALNGAGAYSLVAQQVIQQVMTCLITWPCVKWCPRFMFNYKTLWPMLSHGMKVMGTYFLEFVEQQGPRILIGFYLGPLQVGYYVFASRIFLALKEVLVLPVSTVFYPALALVKDDVQEMEKTTQQVMMIAGFVVFPAFLGSIVTAPQFVQLIFKEEWLPAVPVLQVLLLGSILTPFLLILHNILRVQGRLGAYFKTQLAAVFSLFAVIMATVHHGLMPVMYGCAVVSLSFFPIYVVRVSRRSGFHLWKLFAGLSISVLASVLMSVALLLLAQMEYSTVGVRGWIDLVVAIIVGMVVYAGICFVLKKDQVLSIIQQVKKLASRTSTAENL